MKLSDKPIFKWLKSASERAETPKLAESCQNLEIRAKSRFVYFCLTSQSCHRNRLFRTVLGKYSRNSAVVSVYRYVYLKCLSLNVLVEGFSPETTIGTFCRKIECIHSNSCCINIDGLSGRNQYASILFGTKVIETTALCVLTLIYNHCTKLITEYRSLSITAIGRNTSNFCSALSSIS